MSKEINNDYQVSINYEEMLENEGIEGAVPMVSEATTNLASEHKANNTVDTCNAFNGLPFKTYEYNISDKDNCGLVNGDKVNICADHYNSISSKRNQEPVLTQSIQ